MKKIDFESFWEYLLNRASDNDAWWLDGWLEDCLEEFENIVPCSGCGSTAFVSHNVWSKTRNHVLEYQIKCEKCDKLVSTKSNREAIATLIQKGEVKVKDLPILKVEIATPNNALT